MRILSGLKPTGRPHLGNYLGALRQWIDLQDAGEAFYFLADLHALNQVRDAETMRTYTMDAALDYMALGLDPERCTLFVQSHVPEVSELTWILGTVTPMGLLQRAHAYKDALVEGEGGRTIGLFAYPDSHGRGHPRSTDSDLVPVGKDQKQHIEITRDIAVKFNQAYCPGFDPHTGEGGALRLPKESIVEDAAVVPGTDGQKMSKSYNNTIPLFASDKRIKKAINRIVTDATPVEDPKDPATCNVFAILRLLVQDAEREAMAARYRAGGLGYGEVKKLLIDRFHDRFDAARARRAELESDLGAVEAVLVRGAAAARASATVVLDRVRRACGIR